MEAKESKDHQPLDRIDAHVENEIPDDVSEIHMTTSVDHEQLQENPDPVEIRPHLERNLIRSISRGVEEVITHDFEVIGDIQSGEGDKMDSASPGFSASGLGTPGVDAKNGMYNRLKSVMNGTISLTPGNKYPQSLIVCEAEKCSTENTIISASQSENNFKYDTVIEERKKESTCCGFFCWRKSGKKFGYWKNRLRGLKALRGFKTHRKPRDEGEVFARPPYGHHEDYDRGKRILHDAMLREEIKKTKKRKRKIKREKQMVEEETLDITDKSTLFGKITGSVLPDPNENIYKDPEFKEQAKLGAKLIDQVTSKPLSKLGDTFLHIFIHTLFFANLVAEIYDLAMEVKSDGPRHFHYSGPALCIGILENLIVWSAWVAMKTPKIKNSPNYEQHKKHQQYIENILAEIMIYPMIILTVVGFASGKDYNIFLQEEDRKDWFKWTQLILLVADIVYLAVTQVLRLRMLYKLLNDIQTSLGSNAELHLTGNWSLAGRIMFRAFFTVVGNVILFVLLVVMFSAQVHKDNLESEDFSLTMNSGVIMICLLLLPFYSVGLFLLTNYFWIMEIVLKINLTIADQGDIRSKLSDEFRDNEVIQNALELAKSKVRVSKEKYDIIKSTPRWRKVFYGLSEVRILVLLFVYQVVMIGAVIVFDGFETEYMNWTIKAILIIIIILVNGHVAAMAILSNAVIILLGIGVLFYPIFLLICCSHQLDKDIDDEAVDDGDDLEPPRPSTNHVDRDLDEEHVPQGDVVLKSDSPIEDAVATNIPMEDDENEGDH